MNTNSDIVIQTLLDKVDEIKRERISLEGQANILFAQIKSKSEEIRILENAVNQLGLSKDSNVKINGKEAKSFSIVGSKITYGKKDDYPYNGSTSQKAVFAINKTGRFLHTREIAEFIVTHEPKEDLEDTVSRFSKQVTRIVERGQLVAYNVNGSSKNVFYGLPGWLDNQNQIIAGRIYDEKYVRKKYTPAENLFK